MNHEEVATWLGIAFAVLLGLALIVWTYRVQKQRNAPVVRIDRELAKARASRPPRTQHFAFAHQRLRDALLADPGAAFDRVSAPGSGEFLVTIWNACEHTDEEPISPEGLRATVEDDIAVVTLPPPARTNEVYMVAVTRSGRYFVLERGEESAFLAEWQVDRRVRFGAVSPPSVREMITAVRGALGVSSSAVANT